MLPGKAKGLTEVHLHLACRGGVGFFESGVFLMFPSLSLEAYRIENAIGFGVGSTCFMLGGFLLFIKLSQAKKQMEDEDYDHVRGDSFGSIALSTMSDYI